MIALGALAALFIVAGLTVAGIAFFGSRPVDATPSSGGKTLTYAAMGLICVGIGLAIPFAIVVSNHRNAKEQAPSGVDLTAAQAEGRQLFATTCATCHTLRASNATGRVGPNFDVLKPQAALVENAIKLGRAQGNGNMPALLLSGDDAKNVASYIATVAGH